MKSYDRIEGESAKAYAAFCIYRDMGAARSLPSVAAEFYTEQTSNKRRPCVRQIERWSSQWNWVDRVKEWDLDEEMLQRERHRIANIEDHNRRLEEYRQANEAIGFELLALSTRLLTTIGKMTAPCIARIDSGDPPTAEDWQIMFNLPNAVKSIAGFAQSGSQLAADGLLIRQLMEQLKSEK